MPKQNQNPLSNNDLRRVGVLVIFSFLQCAWAAAPDPQATDKRLCIEEWSKRKVEIDSLLKRKLNMNANRIVEQCSSFWTTPEQKLVVERMQLINQPRDAQDKQRSSSSVPAPGKPTIGYKPKEIMTCEQYSLIVESRGGSHVEQVMAIAYASENGICK